jgi:1-deoxy-D-xylulose-5-phosphate synthase
VTFCMDRAGLSANDGPTHHGLFDIAYLRCVPRAVVMAPKDEHELAAMLRTAVAHDGPAFIRYPRGASTGTPAPAALAGAATLPIGRAEVVRAGVEVQLWALGPMVADALALADKLAAEDGLAVGVVNARFAKPLDRELLLSQAADARLIVTLEDAVATGGFGTAVLETLSEAGSATPVERIGWPDTFVGHASSVAELRAAHGLSPAQMLARVRARLGLAAKAPALA